MYFPPAFFDIMVHVLVHIVDDIEDLGPPFLHNMMALERMNGFIKGYVRNRAHLDGSIVQGFLTEECISFCKNYLNEDDPRPVRLPANKHLVRFEGVGHNAGKRELDADQDDRRTNFNRAHLVALQHMNEVEPWVDQDITMIKSRADKPMTEEEMSHPWMYGNRCAPAFREGVNSFLLVAEANKSKQGFMCCPCLKCKNEKDYSCSRDIKSHLLRFGFMSSYNVWTKHGEEGVMMEDGDEEEDNDEKYRSMFSECFDTAMDDNEEEGGEEQASDDPVDDDLRRAISDARRDCDTDKERLQFDKMLEDHHKLLYQVVKMGIQSWVAYWNC
ncbi:hypothetical protein QYE76_036029 [Lolium multiflorum]|uniref:Transposase-associated domain-containing protein n=1 Tax=Lolium multiflorum TaxID=4521 RepID=A0AAD8R1Z8_LOLMU|nr:hypothetical protein QYE76_036029 [Lolium multiflorum]